MKAMVDTIDQHWDGLFFCHDDPRIPRTDNNLEITIRRKKSSYRRMSGFRSWDFFIATYGRSTFLIPNQASVVDLLRIEESVDRDAFRERWHEFMSRKRTQTLMRKASKDYDAALRKAERSWL